MRKLKRAIARQRMLREGYYHLNRKQSDGRSPFAKHWREYVG